MLGSLSEEAVTDAGLTFVMRCKSTQDPQRMLDLSSVWTGEYILQCKLD
jgi:hypothetical protein